MERSCPDEEVILGFAERTLSGPARTPSPRTSRPATTAVRCSRRWPSLRATTPRPDVTSSCRCSGPAAWASCRPRSNRELDRKVALKYIVADGGDDERARARLLREAKALAQLAHPNVITVHDVGVLDGDVFVAMWSSSTARTCASGWRRPRARSRRSSTCCARPAKASPPRTPPASSTGISSPRTSSSVATAGRASPTSVSRDPSTRTRSPPLPRRLRRARRPSRARACAPERRLTWPPSRSSGAPPTPGPISTATA